MMRLFYKSRLFWCGVPGLVFLVWVWWDSGGYASDVGWECDGVQWGASVMKGSLWCGSERAGMYQTLHRTLRSRLDLDHRELEADGGRRTAAGIPEVRERGFDFPGPFERRVETLEYPGRTIGIAKVRVALWVIGGCYLAGWLGLMMWRERRRAVMEKRLADSVKAAEKEVVG